MSESFYIIDGSAYFYRAFYAIRELTTSSGLPTNAVYGFTQMLLKIIKDKKPDYLAIAFDAKGPTFRHDLYKEYKAQRPSMPEDLAGQIPYIHKMVKALRIAMIEMAGVEADDLIGTLSKQGEALGWDVVIVTGDKDMYQLITPKVIVYDSMKERVFTEETIQEKFGIPPSQIIEMMGLMGDAVDNIPGVSGVGKKTAATLIQTYGTIENLLSRLDEIRRPKLRQTLNAEGEIARLSRQLATIKTDCPITFEREAFAPRPPDLSLLKPLCEELEFASLLKEMTPALPRPEIYCRMLNEETLPKAMATIERSGEFALTLLGTSAGAIDSDLTGIAFSCQTGEACFYPLGKTRPIPEVLKQVLASESLNLIGHDLKPLVMILKRRGLVCKGKMFDTMIASYLLNPTRRDHSLESVAFECLKEEMSLEGETASSICQEAERVLRLSKCLFPRLESKSLVNLCTEVEMPLITVLAEIEQNGVKIDTALLAEMSKDFETRLSALREKIYALAGEPFNINSPKQLAEILFNRLGLPTLKKTKTGYSTNEKVLQQLSLQHPLPAEILNSRQLTKLKSTYIDALPKQVNTRTGRVHTQLNQAVTATGRLSSKDPNLQNIPVRGALGRQIREAFIAAPGHQLLSADYNQIELRILAHLSEDAALIEAFKKGEDVHTRTAAEIFGLSADEVSQEMRRSAKAVNFGIIYGMGAFGLANNLGVSLAEAKRYIEAYFNHYQGVQTFMEKTLKEATEKGYVTTLFGRRRDIPELASRNSHTRGSGERIAMNTPVQGSAADIIKLAMIAISRWMAIEGLQSMMTLQVHDELLFDVPEAEIDSMKNKVASLMEGSAKLKVPLTVEVGIGANWAEAH